jgi:hypothetical protein
MGAGSGSDIAAISLREISVSQRFSGIDAHRIPLNERIEDPKATHPTYNSPFIHHTPTRIGLRYPQCAGTAQAQERGYHHAPSSLKTGLHPRAQQGTKSRA